MSGSSEWDAPRAGWCTRRCGVFELYANVSGRWSVDDREGDEVEGGYAPDIATAKRAAEDALRRLLVEAMEGLGTA